MVKSQKIKLFQNQKIRTKWDAEKQEWLFAVVDVVAALTDSVNPRDYFKKLRKRDQALADYMGTNCPPVEMGGNGYKKRKVIAGYTKDILRIIQSIPSKKAEPFKLWLAQVGKDRLDEAADPELAIERALKTYLAKGYSREWINQRLQSIQMRKELVDEWNDRGVKSSLEYAILTDTISKGWSGMTTREYKEHKGLHKESLRGNMSNLELVFNMLAEATTTELSKQEKPETFTQNQAVAKRGGTTAGQAREIVEKQLGKSIITSETHFDRLKSNLKNHRKIESHSAESDYAIIIAHLEQFGSITIGQAEDAILGISRRTLQRRFKTLVEKGVIRVEGATNRLRYVLAV